MEAVDRVEDILGKITSINIKSIIASASGEEVGASRAINTLLPFTPLTSMPSLPMPVWMNVFGMVGSTLMLSDVAMMMSLVRPGTGPVRLTSRGA